MNTRQVLIYIGILLVVLILGAGVTRFPAAEPKTEAPAVGRYQIVHASDKEIVVLDTSTGQCWENTIGDKLWSDMGSPAKAK